MFIKAMPEDTSVCTKLLDFSASHWLQFSYSFADFRVENLSTAVEEIQQASSKHTRLKSGSRIMRFLHHAPRNTLLFIQAAPKLQSCVHSSRINFDFLTQARHNVKKLFFGHQNIKFELSENCAVLRYYAASCDNPLPIFRANVLVPSSRAL
jgi:hypothetical protein